MPAICVRVEIRRAKQGEQKGKVGQLRRRFGGFVVAGDRMLWVAALLCDGGQASSAGRWLAAGQRKKGGERSKDRGSRCLVEAAATAVGFRETPASLRLVGLRVGER